MPHHTHTHTHTHTYPWHHHSPQSRKSFSSTLPHLQKFTHRIPKRFVKHEPFASWRLSKSVYGAGLWELYKSGKRKKRAHVLFCLGFFSGCHFMGVYLEGGGLPSKRIRKCPLYSGDISLFLSGGTCSHEKRYFGAFSYHLFWLYSFWERGLFVISWLFFSFVFWNNQTLYKHVTKRIFHHHFQQKHTIPATAKDSYGVRELRDGYQMRDLAEVNPDATLSGRGGGDHLFSLFFPNQPCLLLFFVLRATIPLFPPNLFPSNPLLGSSCFLPTRHCPSSFCNSQDKPILSYGAPSGYCKTPSPPAPNQSHSS
ncbi:hypothetical protein J3F84DRAFT_257132 [Trichoderma pleuroticola]